MTMNVRGLYEEYEMSFLWWGQHMRPCAARFFFAIELIRLRIDPTDSIQTRAAHSSGIQ